MTKAFWNDDPERFSRLIPHARGRTQGRHDGRRHRCNDLYNPLNGLLLSHSRLVFTFSNFYIDALHRACSRSAEFMQA